MTVTAAADDDTHNGQVRVSHRVSGYGVVGPCGRDRCGAGVLVTVVDAGARGSRSFRRRSTLDEGQQRNLHGGRSRAGPLGTVTVRDYQRRYRGGDGLACCADLHHPDDWSDAQTVTVTAPEDPDGKQERVAVSHAVEGYAGVAAGGAVTVTVADPEMPPGSPAILTMAPDTAGPDRMQGTADDAPGFAFTFSPPTTTGGVDPAKIIYELSWKRDSGTFTPAPSAVLNPNGALLTGLTGGEEYELRLEAVNAFGNSLPVGFVGATPTADCVTAGDAACAPGPPVLSTPTAGEDSIALSWTAPAYTGAWTGAGSRPGISGYTVSYETADGTVKTVERANAAATTETLSDLQAGTQYKVSVAATNDATPPATGPPASATVATRALMVTAQDVSVAEGAGNATLTLSIVRPSGETRAVSGTVTPAFTAGAGKAAAADLTSTTAVNFTIAGNASSTTVNIPIAQDDVIEGDESFTAEIAVTAPTAAPTISGGPAAMVTITDDDAGDAGALHHHGQGRRGRQLLA